MTRPSTACASPSVEPSIADKARAVLGLMRGDAPDAIAREYQVPEQTVRAWERSFMRVAESAFTDAAPEPSALQRLFGADSAESFLTESWPHHPFVEHGPVERLGLPSALSDVEALVRAPGVRATLFGEKGFRAGTVNATDAINFYRAGTTLYLTGLAQAFPTLQRLADGLARELEIDTAHVAVEAFASPCGGTGSSFHYDFDVNFNVQLVGEKIWRIAPNVHVTNPLYSLAVRENVAPVHPFDGSLLPTTMPADAQSFRLGPGGMVFLPRGYWHETVVMSESLAIAVVVKPPPFFRLLATELSHRLQHRASWRAYALGPDRRRDFEAALAELPDIIAELSADEVLFNQVRVRWPSASRRSLVPSATTASPASPATPWILAFESDDAEFELPVTEGLATLVRWMVAHDGVFSTESAAAACPDCSIVQARGVVTYLIEVGVLERA